METTKENFNKYVNLIHVDEFLKKEIKEVSERWGQFMINKRALEKEKNGWIDYGKSQEKRLMNLLKKMRKMKDDDKRQKFLAEQNAGTREKLMVVSEREDKKSALEQAVKGIKEFEEFLEVATELKIEVEEKLAQGTVDYSTEKPVPIKVESNEEKN